MQVSAMRRYVTLHGSVRYLLPRSTGNRRRGELPPPGRAPGNGRGAATYPRGPYADLLVTRQMAARCRHAGLLLLGGAGWCWLVLAGAGWCWLAGWLLQAGCWCWLVLVGPGGSVCYACCVIVPVRFDKQRVPGGGEVLPPYVDGKER